ncbi:prepilin-type N-terminal cleavage/methylation domain-containing protein [Photobacterium swingsii]|uniref:Prepilin-type N-terminal cleavage/methylation domain-containing protein n=2 Tax=Photobacterium swingsii TaxID=680026 RepID=A0A2T3P6V3_9GAMM|nr:type IV pilin protein [Photobacterium swingsii]PSW24277.1 prepilin-type N-terminal cleavage/methylation domain-containing protein [Photobacterium swingsii]
MDVIDMYAFQKGMTLIEILIAVVIVGILSAIAVPAYTSHIEKSRRIEAQTGLIELHLWAEQYYTENTTYPSSTDLSAGNPQCTSCSLSDEYTFSINNSGTGTQRFILKAVVKTTGLQKGDPCKSLTIDASGAKKGSPSSAECW